MAIAYGISGDFHKCGSLNSIFLNQNFWSYEVVGSSVCGGGWERERTVAPLSQGSGLLLEHQCSR